MKGKRVKPKTGDVFAVPLSDGTFGLGHVVRHEYLTATCALFARRAGSPGELLIDLDEALRQPLTILELTDCNLRSGYTPIISHREIDYSEFDIPTDGKGTSHTSGMAIAFIEAYHGLEPWDGMHDPRYYEKRLIPGLPVPPTVRYKRDFPPPLGTAPPVAPPSPPPITEGPAEIYIQILYPGNDLPTVEQLRTRQELERRLEAEGAGEVTDAGGGDGVMDIYLQTEDVQRAMPIAERLIAELGLAADTLIETSPIDEEEEDEKEDDSNDD